jgi:hypothetical protein
VFLLAAGQAAPPSTENPSAAVTTETMRSCAIALDRANRNPFVNARTVASVFNPALCQPCLTKTSPATIAMMTITTIILSNGKPA